jgi:hypothetical protein
LGGAERPRKRRGSAALHIDRSPRSIREQTFWSATLLRRFCELNFSIKQSPSFE